MLALRSLLLVLLLCLNAVNEAVRSKGCRLALISAVGMSDTRPSRWNEIEAAVRANSDLVSPSCMHLLVDSPLPFNASDYSDNVFHVQSQPDYAKLFSHANKYIPTGTTTIITHSDIMLDPASFWCDIIPDHKTIWSLSRHPHPSCPKGSGAGARGAQLPNNLCHSDVLTADTWLFSVPVTPVFDHLNHFPNVLGAENRAMCAFALGGYDILNPCICFKAFHVHCERARSSRARINAKQIENKWCTDPNNPSNQKFGKNYRTPELCSDRSCSVRDWTARYADITLGEFPTFLGSSTDESLNHAFNDNNF